MPFLLLGVGLFGLGIGNVTSLPPLIAQAEFTESDVPRAIALSTATAQATYAFSPAVFGALRVWGAQMQGRVASSMILFFTVAAVLQIMAAVIYLMGRRPSRRESLPAQTVG